MKNYFLTIVSRLIVLRVGLRTVYVRVVRERRRLSAFRSKLFTRNLFPVTNGRIAYGYSPDKPRYRRQRFYRFLPAPFSEPPCLRASGRLFSASRIFSPPSLFFPPWRLLSRHADYYTPGNQRVIPGSVFVIFLFFFFPAAKPSSKWPARPVRYRTFFADVTYSSPAPQGSWAKCWSKNCSIPVRTSHAYTYWSGRNKATTSSPDSISC